MGKGRLPAASVRPHDVMACEQTSRNSLGSPVTGKGTQRTISDSALFSRFRHARFNELVAHARNAVTEGRPLAPLGHWGGCCRIGPQRCSRARSCSAAGAFHGGARASWHPLWSSRRVSSLSSPLNTKNYWSTQDCSAGRERGFHGARFGAVFRYVGEEHGATSSSAR